MKCIPVKDLKEILSTYDEDDSVSENHINYLFSAYGDDWFKDYGSSPYELVNENKDRRDYIDSLRKDEQ